MFRLRWALLPCLLALAPAAAAEEILLSVGGAPHDGLVVARVDLTAAVAAGGVGAVAPAGIEAESAHDGQAVPFQFVPDGDFDPVHRVAGMVILQIEGSEGTLRLRFTEPPAAEEPWDGTVVTEHYRVEHGAAEHGGLPGAFTITAADKRFDNLRWADRLHHREQGSFLLAGGAQATAERLAAGPLATVVRVRARYRRGAEDPPAAAGAVYDWYYFHDRPWAFVTAAIRQPQPFTWHEVHFLELTQPGNDFPAWAGGEPLRQGEFAGAVETFGFPDWGALVDGTAAIGMFRCGQALFYDHRDGGATYLQAHGDAAWQGWEGTELGRSAWLWIGTDDEPAAAVRAAALSAVPSDARVTVELERVGEAIAEAAAEIEALPAPARRSQRWRVIAAESLQAAGRFDDAVRAAAGELPADWHHVRAGELGLLFHRGDDGFRLGSVFDAEAGRELSATETLPLFRLVLRDTDSGENVHLDADRGWRRVTVADIGDDPARGLEIRWRGAAEPAVETLELAVRAELDPEENAVRWALTVEELDSRWSVWEVAFPQVAVTDLGPGMEVLFPRGPGEVQADVARRGFRFEGIYPNGWTTMPLLAAYDSEQTTGLYVGVHDARGSVRRIHLSGDPTENAVTFRFTHPAADMGVGGNGFDFEGEAHWQLFRGDWFDAALIYRRFVREHALWHPARDRQADAARPAWMRELPVWVMTGGGPENVEAAVRRFAEWAGVPVGFHWYNWHEIPFDNDYPHYFPAREGFAESVARLQAEEVYVMPYINGRLWDTRDRGTEDYQFTEVALPAATKDEEGEPYTETYGSKEEDGSPVRLAVMCPATDLWQEKVAEIVLRLFDECGVAAVYIDQVAAAQPVLCFDATHGHPLGGGWWWNAGYWEMLEAIRRAMPADRALTTECNAEPFVRWFDGYLTWHWQYDGQVPVFPAVYGGSIAMFGRAYRGGPTRDLALRMKAGEQWVYGEQIGWFHPGVAEEDENAAFLRPIIALRWKLRRYFDAGEMARPPRLVGEVPRVTADWQWAGVWPVTTDAVMAGAWHLADEERLVLLFVNVGDEAVETRVEFDAAEYGFAESILLREIALDAGEAGNVSDEATASPARLSRQTTFPPRRAFAWELTAP